MFTKYLEHDLNVMNCPEEEEQLDQPAEDRQAALLLFNVFSLPSSFFFLSSSSSSRGMYFSGTPTPALPPAPPTSPLWVCLQLLSSPLWSELSPTWRSWWRITWPSSRSSGPTRYAHTGTHGWAGPSSHRPSAGGNASLM